MSKVLSSDSRRMVRRETVRALIGEGVIGRRQGRAILAEANVRDRFPELIEEIREYLMGVDGVYGPPKRDKRGSTLTRLMGKQFPGAGVKFHVAIGPWNLFNACGLVDGRRVRDGVLDHFKYEDEEVGTFNARDLESSEDLGDLRDSMRRAFESASLDGGYLVVDFAGTRDEAHWHLAFGAGAPVQGGVVKMKSGRKYTFNARTNQLEDPQFKDAGGFFALCRKISKDLLGDPGAYEAVYRVLNDGKLWIDSSDTPALQAPARPPGRERPEGEESMTGSARINRGREGQFAGSRMSASEY